MNFIKKLIITSLLFFSTSHAFAALYISNVAQFGTRLTQSSSCDDCSDAVNFPGTGQSINFFGTNYTGGFVTSNGLFNFGASGFHGYVPSGLDVQTYAPMIAGYLSDLYFTSDADQGVYVNSSTPGQLVITWYKRQYYGSQTQNTRSTFQLVIRSTQFTIPSGEGQIGFFYDTITDTANGSAGFGDGTSAVIPGEVSIYSGAGTGLSQNAPRWYTLGPNGVPVDPNAQVNGVCGTAANTAASILPSINLCSTGTAGQVSSALGQYSWTCSGTGGGTNASCTAPWATNAGTGSGTLTASNNNGWTVSSASFTATPPVALPRGVALTNGLLDLTLTTGTSGSDATVVVQYTTAVPAGAVYMKYGKTATNPTDHWYQLAANRAVFAADRMSVTLTLTDGGAGDNDLTANSTIVDPGGPALVTPDPIPTLSEWAMIFLASLMGMFAYTRMRRQS